MDRSETLPISNGMKVILYMAITANGYIAKKNGDTGFVSDTEWESFQGMVKRTGNIIIGRRTYEVMEEGGEFSKLEDVKVIVLTQKQNLKSSNPNIVFINQSPKEVLELLQKDGFEEILVAGGGEVNSSFMKEGLVDEIYLDVEPIVIGKGIKLFSEVDFEAQLELIETKHLSVNEIQLHYRVKK